MVDDVCEWLTQGRLPEFASLPDMFKESQIDQCKIWCPDYACSFAEQYKVPEHDCSFSEQDRALNQFTSILQKLLQQFRVLLR